MNQVPIIVHNPAQVADVELDEDEVDPADLTPLISGDTLIVTVPASEDEDVAEDVVENNDEDEEMEDVPQILRDIIVSLAELNKEITSYFGLSPSYGSNLYTITYLCNLTTLYFGLSPSHGSNLYTITCLCSI